MTRYLFPWSGATDVDTASDRLPWTADNGPSTTPADLFFYPPTSASGSPQTPIGIHHPLPTTNANGYGTTALSTMNSGEREKPRELNPNSNQLPMNSSDPSDPPPSPSMQQNLHPTLKVVLLLTADVFLALCLGSALSVVYLLIGHAILRATHPYPNLYFTTTLLSSINAGALGGLILALPLALLAALLIPPTEPAPDDFFDDDTGLIHTLLTWRSISKVVCGMLAMVFGAISGPIGVLCLGGGREGNNTMLDPPHASAAGAVGGAVGGPAVLVAVVLVLAFWKVLRRGVAAYTGT